jgi:hypothetical protein
LLTPLSFPGNADILGNYAQFLLGERGEHAAAESMFKRALAAREGHTINLVRCWPFAATNCVGVTRSRLRMLSFWRSIGK